MKKPRRAGTADRRRSAGQSAHTLKRTADLIDGMLPQMHCRHCGYSGCRPYAEALAAGRAAPDLCLPGGSGTARAVACAAGLTDGQRAGREERGTFPAFPKQVARIDERSCVGCIKCIEACPVDAVIGSLGMMHTVMTQSCTGCGLCVEPCPVDCIVLEAVDDVQPDFATAVVGGVVGRPAARKVAELLRVRHARKLARTPVRNSAQSGTARPEDLAAAALVRAGNKIAGRRNVLSPERQGAGGRQELRGRSAERGLSAASGPPDAERNC